MIKVAGVRFRGSGKVYFFDPASFEVKGGSHVIVDTARGSEYGVVCGPLREVSEEQITQPLRQIIRVADEEDERRISENSRREKEAMVICKEKIRLRGLDMKLIDAEYTFDNSKLLFYFTADGRIDFRELVKDLAGVFRTRIELRQIGVRDETKILGGIGICGRPLCCHTWLTDFVPVSIKMAKEQNLSLNPAKISGTCGRLMCCLKNEEETYEYLNSTLPAQGDTVTTPTGLTGTVHSVSVLRQKVKVVIEEEDEKEIQEYNASDLKFSPRKGKDHSGKKHPHKEASEKHEAEEAEGEESFLTDSAEAKEKEPKELREAKKPDAKQPPRERRDRREKRERPEKAEKAEKAERTEKPERAEKPERPEKPERAERPERSEKPDEQGAQAKGGGDEKRHRRHRGRRPQAQQNQQSQQNPQTQQASQQGKA